MDSPTPPTEPQPAPKRLVRAADDRMLTGVAGGLARHLGVDPTIVRVVFVATTLFGGLGVLAYLAAWLFVPDEASGETVAQSNRTAAIAGVVVLGLGVLALSDGPALWFAGPGLFGLVVIFGVGYAIWRAAGGSGGSVLARVLLVFVAGMVAIAAMLAVAVGAALGGGPVLAGLVILAGVALIAGAASGRSRWLIVPALLIAMPVGLVAAADIDTSGGVGERTYRPADVGDLRSVYEIGMGELEIDLRDVDLPDGITPLTVDVGVGHAIVLVDEDVCVAPDVEIGIGYAGVLDRGHGGLDVDWQESAGTDTGPRIALDAEVGIGVVEVAHDEHDFDRDGFGPGDHERGPADACIR